MMLPLVVAALSFNLPPMPETGATPSSLRRRDALAVGLGALSAVVAAPLPAHAQRSKLIPKSSAESTASFKAYQLSDPKYKPGEESEAFKAAEAKRKALNSGGAAVSKEDDLKRLGLKSYGDTAGGR